LTGTHPGSDDIVEFTSAGLSNIKSIRHLHLRSGQVYYATIRGTSFLSVLCHARVTKDATDCHHYLVYNLKCILLPIG